MAKTKQTELENEELENDLPEDEEEFDDEDEELEDENYSNPEDEAIESLDTIKKRLEKQGKKDGSLNQ